MDLYPYLCQFHPLPTADFELLRSLFKPCSFSKGELITVPGQVQRELYFIRQGIQMSYFEGESKTHVIAFTYAPNLCAIPDSFSFQAPAQYYLTCLSDTEADAISYEDLQGLFDQSQDLERLFRKMTEAVLAGMISRHIELHALPMAERYLRFCRRSPHLLQQIPHKYIASYLGIDPTNFSKLFNQLRI